MSSVDIRVDERMDVDGLAFRARGAGSSGDINSPTYILIHGIGTSHRYFERLLKGLAKSAAVYSIDIPGFGGLPKPNVAPSVADVAQGLGVVLDRLGIRNAILVGHSMGAQWVVEAGILRPDLVDGVVVIGPVTDRRHRTLLAQAGALGLDVLGETPTVNAVVLVDYLRCGPSWFLREARPMLTYPIEKRVALLEVPLLVIRGGSDPIAGIRWCRELRDSARFGRLVVVPGHWHVVQFTAPNAVISAIHSFVAVAETSRSL